jgi:hypothetical protein
MCVLARRPKPRQAAGLTIVDFHQPSRNSRLTAGAVIASAGLRPLVPYTCRRRSGPSQEEVVASPSGGLFCLPVADCPRTGRVHRSVPTRICKRGRSSNTVETRRPHWSRIGSLERLSCRAATALKTWDRPGSSFDGMGPVIGRDLPMRGAGCDVARSCPGAPTDLISSAAPADPGERQPGMREPGPRHGIAVRRRPLVSWGLAGSSARNAVRNTP